MNNIKKIYQHSGKCDDQQDFKDIIENAMFSTPESITYDSHSLPLTQTTVKNQILGNCCIYSPTCLVLKRELLSVLLELQDQNTEPLKPDVTYGQMKKKGIQTSAIRSNASFIYE